MLIARSCHRYRSVRPDQLPLRRRLRELAFARPRFGYRRLCVLLRREGWRVNPKRILRLYRQEGLLVRTKRRKKRASHMRTVPPPATRANERWALDFVSDSLSDGTRYRVLTVIDIHSREALACDVGRSMTSESVTATLDRVIRVRRKPTMLTLDNGTEFTANHFDAWAHRRGIQLDFIRPGRPVENAFIESFNGSLRDECLNTGWFDSLEEARCAIEAWRVDYNVVRSHSSLGGLLRPRTWPEAA
jgi:putative transposase